MPFALSYSLSCDTVSLAQSMLAPQNYAPTVCHANLPIHFHLSFLMIILCNTGVLEITNIGGRLKKNDLLVVNFSRYYRFRQPISYLYTVFRQSPYFEKLKKLLKFQPTYSTIKLLSKQLEIALNATKIIVKQARQRINTPKAAINLKYKCPNRIVTSPRQQENKAWLKIL